MKLNFNHSGIGDNALKHVLIVGSNGRAENLLNMVGEQSGAACHIEGFVDDNPDRRSILERLGADYLGPISALDRLLIDRVVDRVYVCLPLRSSYDTAQRVLNVCERAGVSVHMVTDLFPWRARSRTTWCMVPRQTADLVARPQQSAPSGLNSLGAGTMTPFFRTLSAVFFALISGMLLVS